jgi:hypothetical protein
LLDLGQLTWSRLSNVSESDKQAKASITPEVNFAQVVSPGVYLHVSAGNSPFVFGAGVSFAPALRDYTLGSDASAKTEPLDTLRLGVFIAVDVTILPLWSDR